MTKRHLLGYILSALPHGAPSAVRRTLKGRFLTVLAYHRVMDKPEDFPFDDDLISADTRGFRYQMEFVARHFEVINFKQLSVYMDKKGELPERALIITFDDGYIDNYETAYPILAGLGLTAVMFVTAGYIGTDKLFWWDRIAYIVKNAVNTDISLDEPVRIRVSIESFPTRQDAARLLIKEAKKLPDERKEELIKRLSDAAGVEMGSLSYRNTMSWEQVKELAENGFEIGSHSVNHPIFSNVSAEQISYEVKESKAIIESRTGTDVMTFGAPGRGIIPADEKAVFERVLEQNVVEAGYRFSTQYRWGLVYEREFNPLRISRLGIEMHDTPGLFRAKLAFPGILRY